MLKLMMLTHSPGIAQIAQDAGVDRIFYDLEYINKRERQSGRNTVMSEYNLEGIADVRKVLSSSELVVRVNPIYFNFEKEVETVLQHHPDFIMLPMALDSHDVKQFIDCVNGRAKTIVMIETTQALARIDEILEVDGIDEIFVGLNDLHIGLGLDFMFEIVAFGLIDYIAQKCRNKNIPFGFGGIAKIGQGDLPAEYVIGEHYRMGSGSVILSRAFKSVKNNEDDLVFDFDFQQEVDKIRAREIECANWSQAQHSDNHQIVKNCVQRILNRDE